MAVVVLAAWLVVRPAPPASARGINDLSDSVSMDCTGWAITAVPFNVDTDGDGLVTVTVSVNDAANTQLDDETFSFPPGTTHDLEGTFTTPPTLNNLFLSIKDEQGAEEYVGSCESVDWSKPYVEMSLPVQVGATEFTVATYASCYGTTLDLVLRNDRDEVVGQWSTKATTRLSFASFVTLPLPGGFDVGTYQLTAICGTFDAPLSPPFAAVAVTVAPPATSTTEPVVTSPQGVQGVPTFTG